MRESLYFSIVSVFFLLILFPSNAEAQLVLFSDNFDSYSAGAQVACQNPVDWTTWNFTPCDGITDPFVSNVQSFSSPNSVKIIDENDLVYPIPNYTSGKYKISFYMYVPAGFDAYWNVLQLFNGANSVWGFQAYYDIGGFGYIDGSGIATVATFNYSYDTWMLQEMIVDLDADNFEFWVDGTLVYSGIWSPGIGGGGLTQLGGVDLYGYNGLGNGISTYYFDDFTFTDLINVPVELTSFTATANALGNVILNWTTATETNNHGFEIQRKPLDGEFRTIAFAEGYGTTTEEKSYSYTDNTVSAGTYFYRLKQVDFNGDYEYSDEIEVEVLPPLQFALEQNFPNPFNPSTTIRFSIPGQNFTRLAVYDVLGKEVAILINETLEAGFHEIQFDASSLPSGAYFYRIQAGDFVQVRKMLLSK
ncbi:MAG: hypothetical protein Kow0098_08590 [Ignavibacteriaceae bacterium]